MINAYLGIGTNIGNKKSNLAGAVDALGHLPGTKVDEVSSYYETDPVGYTQQDRFLNACVKLSTELTPNALLGACLGIEAAFGRERPFKNSPRTLDIDVLLYGDTIMNTAELTLPHPRMCERGFVLVPLKDILLDMKVGEIDFNSAYDSCDKNGINKSY